MTKTSDNRLPDGNPFPFVDAPTISNSTGNQVTFGDNLVPATANTYDISGGWRYIEAGGSAFNDVSTDGISTRQAAQIQLYNDIYPNFDNQRSLGSASLKFANFYVNDTRTATLRTDTLRTFEGLSIQTNASIRPVSNNGAALGTSTVRFSDTYTSNLTTININAVTGNDLRLVTSGSNAILAASDVIPEATGVLQLGNTTSYWENIYGADVYQSQNSTFKTFSWGSAGAGTTVTSATYSKVAVFLGTGPYDAGNNQFRFPTPGLYAITFDSNADIALGGSYNFIQYRLFETTTSAAYSPPVYHYVGGSSAVQSTQITLYTFISSTTLRVQIEVAKKSGGADVTNVYFGQSLIYRIAPTF